MRTAGTAWERWEMSAMQLTRRELVVLREVVETYIQRGEPVASAQVARSPRVALSPATVRTVMARLEERGLFSRRHPSAGCAPTDACFRVYVDAIARSCSLPARRRHRLAAQLAGLRRDLVEDLGWVARLVAEATEEAGVALRPLDERPGVRAVSLVALGSGRVLGVMVMADGTVVKRVFALGEELPQSALHEMANYLTRALAGRVLADVVDDLGREDDRGAEVAAGIDMTREVARSLLAEADGEAEVLVAGAEHLLADKEFSGVERFRSLLGVLENRRRIVREWRRVLEAERTQVIIGRESDVTASGNLGMVATLFYRDGRRAGAVGVVGPRRMDYRRIVPVVEYIGDSLTRMLEEPGAQHA